MLCFHLLIVCLDSWLVSYSDTCLVIYPHVFVSPMLDINETTVTAEGGNAFPQSGRRVLGLVRKYVYKGRRRCIVMSLHIHNVHATCHADLFLFSLLPWFSHPVRTRFHLSYVFKFVAPKICFQA